MTLPNFLIIGAGKSGTSSLYRYLSQHPQIYMSPHKEPRYFAFQDEKPKFIGAGTLAERYNETTVLKAEDYKNLFNEASNYRAVGEASPAYMYFSSASRNIHKLLPEAKIVAILRNPADRAFSAFCHALREGAEETRDFPTALKLEQGRIASNWGTLWRYVDMGKYYEQLKRYYDIFKHENIKVLLYDDLQKNTKLLLDDLFRFLEVDAQVQVDSTVVYNRSDVGTPPGILKIMQNKWVSKGIKYLIPTHLKESLRKRLTTHPIEVPPFNQQVRSDLLDLFYDDIKALEQLIGRDLSCWLGKNPGKTNTL